MRILKRVPHSVLWLLADNERAKANLLRFAEEQGVPAERLVFAPRVPVAEYLGRFVAADLFLDLSPFNGGTTAAAIAVLESRGIDDAMRDALAAAEQRGRELGS